MKKLNEIFRYALEAVLVGFFYIILNKYVNNNINYLPESFMEDKNIFEALALVCMCFMIFGILKYYVENLYTKINWKLASIINYIYVVSSIIIIFWYLEFVTNIISFITLFVLISIIFISQWVYHYKKNSVKF